MADDASDIDENIRSVLRSAPAVQDSVLSGEFDCSVDDVEQVRDEFDEDLNISELDFGISFGHPYSISATERVLRTTNLSDGDVIQLVFESEGETNSAYGQVRRIPDDEDWWEKELHAVAYGVYHCFDDVVDAYPDVFSGLTIAGDGTPEIDGQEEFQIFIEGIRAVTEDVCSTSGFIIGAGLMEIGTDDRHIDDLVETPLFKLERADFIDFLDGDRLNLVDWIYYEGDVDTPERVHFAYYGEPFGEDRLERARNAILEHDIYQADWNYTIPNFITLVGPTAIGTSSPVIEVTDENLEIIPGKQREAISQDGLGVDFDWFEEYVSDIGITNIGGSPSSTPEEHQAESDESVDEPPTVPHRVLDGDSTIIFLFDPVNVVLHIEDDRLVWRYPDDIDVLRELVLQLTQDIESRLDIQLNIQDAREPQQPSLPESDDWILDTNAFYHEIIENEPSSILHTIFPNDCFYKSRIHLPWIVPFEINKHPDRRGATKADIKQARTNIQHIKSLSELGFFDLEVDAPPDEIQVDVGQSDIADMHVLQYIQEEDQVLLTSDKDLQTISRLWDITVLDVSMLAEVPDTPTPDQQLREEVLNKIGTQYEYEVDILAAIRQHQNQQQTKDAQFEGSPRVSDETDNLEQWRRQGDVICGPEENPPDEIQERITDDVEATLRYGQAAPVDLVPTPEAVREIHSEWITDSDHLRYELLDNFKQQLDLSGAELPIPTFHVPTQTVIAHADSGTREPSEMNKMLYKLRSLENADYSSESLRVDDTELSATITLAKENTWSVVVHSDQDYLHTLGGALGVHVITLPTSGGGQ
ncbi:hypothetical protein [Haloplanus halobius]|uniref:hypothetical protein n=1 Tax=Haloplanus halobius TaxID=2934938 RepID=UPI00200CE4D6|nr:hypothetical protein [Haloplanus sp. XH21]